MPVSLHHNPYSDKNPAARGHSYSRFHNLLRLNCLRSRFVCLYGRLGGMDRSDALFLDRDGVINVDRGDMSRIGWGRWFAPGIFELARVVDR